jgi:hypothetical protein
MNPQGGPAIIEIEIVIEIGKLAGLDFDHDFDFDTDSELPRFENKLALGKSPICLAEREAVPYDGAEGGVMSDTVNESRKPGEISISEKTIEAIIVRLIPTSQYFEVRFDGLEQKFDYKFEVLNDKFDQLAKSHESLKLDMDKRFQEVRGDMDKRFQEVRDDMDKRFQEVRDDMDKRFEQVDKRFEQVDAKLDKIIERIDRRIDEGLRENRAQSFRLFSFAMTFSAISMVGMLGRLFNLF